MAVAEHSYRHVDVLVTCTVLINKPGETDESGQPILIGIAQWKVLLQVKATEDPQAHRWAQAWIGKTPATVDPLLVEGSFSTS